MAKYEMGYVSVDNYTKIVHRPNKWIISTLHKMKLSQ